MPRPQDVMARIGKWRKLSAVARQIRRRMGDGLSAKVRRSNGQQERHPLLRRYGSQTSDGMDHHWAVLSAAAGDYGPIRSLSCQKNDLQAVMLRVHGPGFTFVF